MISALNKDCEIEYVIVARKLISVKEAAVTSLRSEKLVCCSPTGADKNELLVGSVYHEMC